MIPFIKYNSLLLAHGMRLVGSPQKVPGVCWWDGCELEKDRGWGVQSAGIIKLPVCVFSALWGRGRYAELE